MKRLNFYSMPPERGDVLDVLNVGLGISQGLPAHIRSLASMVGNNRVHNYMRDEYNYNIGNDAPVQYLEDGGVVTDTPAPHPTEEVQTEEVVVEDGEFVILPSGQVMRIQGDTHEEGGERVTLPVGTKVISNSKTIGAELSKDMNSKFNIRTVAGTTYASAMNMIKNKIGLTDKEEELEKISEKAQEEITTTEDDVTRTLNLQQLSSSMEDVNNSTLGLRQQFLNVGDYMFQKQGADPEVTDTDDREAKLKATQEKYGLSDEQVASLKSEIFEDGGLIQANTTPLQLTPAQMADLVQYYSRYLDPSVIEAMKTNPENYVFNPNLIQALATDTDIPTGKQVYSGGTYGKVGVHKLGGGFLFNDTRYGSDSAPFESSNPMHVASIQKAYNDAYQNRYGSQYVSGVNAVVDSKFGDRTASYFREVAQVKGNKEALLDTDKIQSNPKEAMEALKALGVGYEDIEGYINPLYKYIRVTPETSSPSRVSSPSVSDPIDSIVPTLGVSAPGLQPTALTQLGQSPGVNGIDDLIGDVGTPKGGLSPQFIGIPPIYTDKVTYGKKFTPAYKDVEALNVSPVEAINTAVNQQGALSESVNNLSPEVRAGLLAGVTANTQQSVNNAVAQSNAVNMQAQQSVRNVNAQFFNANELARVQQAESYERRAFMAEDAYRQGQHAFAEALRSSVAQRRQDMMNWGVLQTANPNFELNPFTGAIQLKSKK